MRLTGSDHSTGRRRDGLAETFLQGTAQGAGREADDRRGWRTTAEKWTCLEVRASQKAASVRPGCGQLVPRKSYEVPRQFFTG